MNGGTVSLPASTLLEDPRWLPFDLDLRAGQFLFVEADRAFVESTPFLDQRADLTGRRRAALAFNQLPGPVERQAAPAFIWHSAFCASTLLARCLSVEGRTIAYSEPSGLATLASLKRHGHTTEFNRLFPLYMNLLARPPADAGRVVIKPTNAANSLISDCAALWPDARHLFVTSELPVFLTSILKKSEPGRAFTRQLYTMFARDGSLLGQIPPEQAFQLTDIQIAALVWQAQLAMMREASAKLDPARTAWLDGDDFLARPEASLDAASRFLDLGLDAQTVQAVVAGPLMSRDVKNPGKAFDPASRRAPAGLKPLMDSHFDAVIAWSASVARTPQSPYPARPLVDPSHRR